MSKVKVTKCLKFELMRTLAPVFSQLLYSNGSIETLKTCTQVPIKVGMNQLNGFNKAEENPAYDVKKLLKKNLKIVNQILPVVTRVRPTKIAIPHPPKHPSEHQ